MLKNYLKIALRSVRRHKGYAAINIVGLAVGMACCLLILLFIRDELSYDRFHDNADRIHRIQSDWGDFSLPATNPPMVASLKAELPDVPLAQFLRNGALIRVDDRMFQEGGILFTTPTVFDVFSFTLVQGNPETALERPFTVVLTEETAHKYFGDTNPIGQSIRIDNQFDGEVTGIVENVPDNSHVDFDFLFSWATLDALFDYSNSTSWGNNSIYTYLLLPEGTTPETIEAQLPDIIERRAGDNWNGSELSLQALTDIHLHSQHNMELGTNSDVTYTYIFSIIGVFILLVACINFMNLATARSAERASEVGVRKVVGAQRKQLIGQFLAESVVMAVFALLLAVLLVVLALPAFRELSGKALSLGVITDGFTILAFLGLTVLVGILAGSYPALALSSFQPVRVLKGRFQGSRGGIALRKVLVVFQFATSVALIVGTAVVYQQLDFLRTANLGIDEAQVLDIGVPDQSLNAQFGAFREALLQQPGVSEVSIASEGVPSELLNGSSTRFSQAPGEQEFQSPTRTVAVGNGFIETLGVEMVAGRAFSVDFPADSSAFMLNETAARQLLTTLPDQYKTLDDMIGAELFNRGNTGLLVGITADFNFSSLREAVEPVVFFFDPNWYDHYLIRVEPENLTTTIDLVEQTWAQVYPDWPFAFQFADEAIDAQYRAEERLGHIFTVFAVLAILIACLGLLGLAAFTARQRTKEIGVRKVLGASVSSIVVLLSKDFAGLMLVAIAVAVPVAYIAMQRWLSGFAYQIDLGVGVFVLAAVIVTAIALFTVSYQSIKAAMGDPVKALRYE